MDTYNLNLSTIENNYTVELTTQQNVYDVEYVPYIQTDNTLDDVTSRGNITTNSISVGALTATDYIQTDGVNVGEDGIVFTDTTYNSSIYLENEKLVIFNSDECICLLPNQKVTIEANLEVFNAITASSLSASGTITGSNLTGTNTGDQDLSGLVPYSGATRDLDLGTYSVNAYGANISSGGISLTDGDSFSYIYKSNGILTIDCSSENVYIIGDTTILGNFEATKLISGAGSVSAPSMTFTGDTDTGIYSSGLDTLNFVTGGTERVEIAENGSVIVNRPLDNSDIDSPLHVAGLPASSSLGQDCVMLLERPFNAGVSFPQQASFNLGRYASSSGKTQLEIRLSEAGGTLEGSSAATVPGITLRSDYKCGIGTVLPLFPLDVANEKIGIDSTQVLYLPDQTDFVGSIFVGDGGGDLVHTTSTEGQFNTGVGIYSMSNVTTGSRNTGIGYKTNFSLTTGSSNVAIGYTTLNSNTEGDSNTGIGTNALFYNSTGDNNLALGSGALQSNTTGSLNVGIGASALVAHQTGVLNVGIGYAVGMNHTTGNTNVFIGGYTGRFLADGTSPMTSASNCTLVGGRAYTSADGVTNEVVIGYNARGNGSNSVTLGSTSVTKTVLNGDVELTTVNSGIVLSSPDGSRFRITVENDGSLTTTAL